MWNDRSGGLLDDLIKKCEEAAEQEGLSLEQWYKKHYEGDWSEPSQTCEEEHQRREQIKAKTRRMMTPNGPQKRCNY